MKKEEVLSNLEKVESRLTFIETNKRTRAYISISKHINGVGSINDLSEMSELVEAKKVVDSNFKQSDYEKVVADLGLTDDEVSELTGSTVKRFLGLTKDEWDTDFQTKLGEIREETEISKLREAKEILTKYLSSDDMFKKDTKNIESLISNL